MHIVEAPTKYNMYSVWMYYREEDRMMQLSCTGPDTKAKKKSKGR